MALNRIESVDVEGKGNIGMPDTPGLSTEDMQKKLDELSRDVIIPKFNLLVDALTAETAAGDIGAKGGTVQAVLDALEASKATVEALTALAERVTATEEGKAQAADLDALAARVTAAETQKADKSEVLRKGAGEAYAPVDLYDPATKKYVDDRVVAIGAGDMARAVYDTDDDGVVDNAAALGGVPAGDYARSEALAAISTEVGAALAAAEVAQTTAAAAKATADAAIPMSYRESKNTHGSLNWEVNSTNVPDKSFLAYWDGRYSEASAGSNLAYCNRGVFGTAAVRNIGMSLSGTTLTITYS